MQNMQRRFILLVAALMTALAGNARAAPFVCSTVGCSVPIPDRTATFSSVVTGIDLTAYQENGIAVTVPDVAFGTGHHYPNGGVVAPTVIRTSDGASIRGIEVNIANGWGTPTTSIAYAWFTEGVNVAEGWATVTSGGMFGFGDPAGFDELHIGAYTSIIDAILALNDDLASGFQAIALDNVRLAIVPGTATAIPEPASLGLLGAGLTGLAVLSRRRRNSVRRLSIGLALAIAILAASTPMRAAPLIDQGNMTLDPNTNLQWLDISLTDGQSVNVVLGGFGGYVAAGFRVALHAEVLQFFANAGLPAPPSATAANYLPAVSFVNLVGSTDVFNTTFFGPPATVTAAQGFAWTDALQLTIRDPFVAYTDGLDPELGNVCACGFLGTPSATYQEVGVWLVRDAVPIPEPSTLAAFGAGLAVLGLAVARRRARAR